MLPAERQRPDLCRHLSATHSALGLQPLLHEGKHGGGGDSCKLPQPYSTPFCPNADGSLEVGKAAHACKDAQIGFISREKEAEC